MAVQLHIGPETRLPPGALVPRRPSVKHARLAGALAAKQALRPSI